MLRATIIGTIRLRIVNKVLHAAIIEPIMGHDSLKLARCLASFLGPIRGHIRHIVHGRIHIIAAGLVKIVLDARHVIRIVATAHRRRRQRGRRRGRGRIGRHMTAVHVYIVACFWVVCDHRELALLWLE